MNNTTEIAFILDRSGSMESIAETAVKAFNELLEQQQKEHEQTPVRMSLVLFNEDCEVPFASTPAPELPRLSIKAYAPDGMTGLLDAIGRTIDETGARLDAMPEAERPGKVIIAIMTDGLENASKTFNLDQISEKIRHQRDVYKWEFLFLGVNQDAIATAARMNIDHHDSVTFFQNDGSVRKSMRGTSSSLRERKMRLACMAPLAKCVEEADDKE